MTKNVNCQKNLKRFLTLNKISRLNIVVSLLLTNNNAIDFVQSTKSMKKNDDDFRFDIDEIFDFVDVIVTKTKIDKTSKIKIAEKEKMKR